MKVNESVFDNASRLSHNTAHAEARRHNHQLPRSQAGIGDLVRLRSRPDLVGVVVTKDIPPSHLGLRKVGSQSLAFLCHALAACPHRRYRSGNASR